MGRLNLNGWKLCLTCFGTVVAGVMVGICITGFEDWHDYSRVKEALNHAEALAAEAKKEAKEAQESAAENQKAIARLESDVKTTGQRAERIDKRTIRMEQNLYQFLLRQPNANPIPPTQPPPAGEAERPSG